MALQIHLCPQTSQHCQMSWFIVHSDKDLEWKCVKSINFVIYTEIICQIFSTFHKVESLWALEAPNEYRQN